MIVLQTTTNDKSKGHAATEQEQLEVRRAYEAMLADMPHFPTSFRIGGGAHRGFGADFAEIGRDCRKTANAETTTIHFDYHRAIEVTLTCTLYPAYAAYEWTVAFANIGETDSPALSEINGCDYTLTAPNPHLRGIYGDGGMDGIANMPYDINISGMSLEMRNETGRSTYNRFPYFQLTWNGGGAFFAVGWPGQWRAGFCSEGNRLTLTDGQVKLNTYLKPGQTIRTPLSCFLFYSGQDNDRATNLWRRFFIDCNMRHPHGKRFPPATAAASSWTYEEMFRATEQNQIRAIQTYLDNGVRLDYWWMDAGWYYKTGNTPLPVNWLPTGTWYVDEGRFPTRFKAISDYAHSRGTQTILWFEPEVVRLPMDELGENSVKREWILPRSATKLVNYGDPTACRWLLDRACTVMDEGDIDLYRQDYGVACPAAEWQSNDPAEQVGITENLYVQGYLWFLDEMIRRYPDRMIDVCAAGGGRNDLETMRRGVPLHKSDSAYSEHDIKQSMNASLFAWLPYFGTVVNGPDTCTVADRYALRSSYCAMPVMNFHVESPEVDWTVVKACMTEWEQIRDYFYADYYLLTPWNRSDAEWTAWEFFDPSREAGFAAVFRPAHAPEDGLHLVLRGLDEATTYRLTGTDGQFDMTGSGQELMAKGCTVVLPETYSSAVLMIRKV